jgi:hypothetical protein
MRRGTKLVPLAVLCALIIAAPSVYAYWPMDGLPLCTSIGDQWFPRIISDGAGGAIVTWYEDRGGDIYAQRVNASGAAQWTADGLTICTATRFQGYPRITADGAGGAIITWMDYRSGTNYDIYAQRVSASGAVQWVADGVPVCAAAGGQWYPEITSDGAGGAIVTWYDDRNGGRFDIYAQRVSASGAVQWTADGVAICTATGDQHGQMLVSDGAGGAIITWYDARGAGYIYAQRVSASGAVQWAANGVPLCTAYEAYPAIISDDAGGAIVTWTDGRSAPAYDIYAQRVNASGAVQWTANGVALSTGGEVEFPPTITSDGASGAIVTWTSHGSITGLDIYAQRVSASGTVQWASKGLAVCTAMGDQQFSTIASDGAGGAIITWMDTRSTGGIYAQRVNASGAVQWTADGAPLCTAAHVQAYPMITPDGTGGGFVTWGDSRNYVTSSSDIYAQRVDPNGFTATDTPEVPIELRQNYPNPFNPTTTVAYSIPEKCNVTLEVYDVSGKRVASLVDCQQVKGSYTLKWGGKDETGNSVASGIYFYRLTAGNQSISKKMVLLR